MRTNHLIIVFLATFLIGFNSLAQNFSSELGVTLGPVAFKSDYGLENNSKTNFGNIGFGIGLMYFINFSYSPGGYTKDTYFNDHFKLRNELLYHKTELNHYGKYAEKNNLRGLQLRSMHGVANVVELGSLLEWHIFSIRDFDSGSLSFSPYVSLGIHYVYFSPEASSDLGPLGEVATTYPKFLSPDPSKPYINTDDGSTYSIAFSAGSRYRLNDVGDLFVEARWHYYGSDFVDGLDHDNPENKSNDWMFWLNVGYIFYLN